MSVTRVFSLATVFTMLLTLAPVDVAAFNDVFSVTPYSKAINDLKASGVIEGYDDGSFKPGRTLNRAEFLKIVLESRGDEEFEGANCFPDVRDQWFAKYVCSAEEEGIVEGYPDGRFKPENEINFVEAAKIMSLAFGQQMENSSSDWYEPFARALEASNAIPLSFESLEQNVKRGEMAEMMWRLTEKVTDQPSKGYINVKYPDVLVNTSSDVPQRATSCADLRAFTEEASKSNFGYDDMMIMEEAMPMPMMARQAVGAPADGAATASKAEVQNDFSDTNVQVEGVDEADIVKTDGEYLYVIQEGKIRILKAQPANDLKMMSSLSFADEGFNPSQMYVDGNRLTVIGNSWQQYVPNDTFFRTSKMIAPGYGGGNRTTVRIYDISDKTNPSLQRTLRFDGHEISSRKIDDKVYLVMNQSVRWYRDGPVPLPAEADLLPAFSDSNTGGKEVALTRCSDVIILPREPQPQYLIVAVIPTENLKGEVQKEVVLGNANNVYSSTENLYVASSRHRYLWSGKAGKTERETMVYRFAIESDGISMKAQGRVPGTVLNQFSMDEHNGHFRIATTDGDTWSEDNPSTNNLYVLNMSLQRTGTLEDLAPGEQIYSVRFMGDKTYMVTFRTVDPLFVIDTSDPKNPTVLGKLKIPGYSNYLHPYDENHIIGFGKDATVSKDGNTAWYQGMKVALFDVSDTSDPKILHEVQIGDRGTDSPLLNDHKALLFEKENNLLAFPVRVNEISEELKQNNEGTAYGDPVFQGAYVYDLSLDGFKKLGEITHYTADDMMKAGGYLYGKDIQRILRINDALYTVSQIGVHTNDRRTIDEIDTVTYEPQKTPTGCEDDDSYTYMSKDPEECMLIDFACAENETAFSNSCGCGCIER